MINIEIHFLRFSSLWKNALLKIANSESVQTFLHAGSNEDVTSRQLLKLSHGYSAHSPQFPIPLEDTHEAILYLHQFPGLHPEHEISSLVTTWSRYPIFSHRTAVSCSCSDVFSNGATLYLGHDAQSFPHAAIIFILPSRFRGVLQASSCMTGFRFPAGNAPCRNRIRCSWTEAFLPPYP